MDSTIWKTIKLGGYKNVGDLKNTLLQRGFKVGDWANDVLLSPAFTLSQDEHEVDLAQVTARTLGFTQPTHRSEIYEKALASGLALCPLEVGPQLRLAYTIQPHLESLQIGMATEKDSAGHESQFRIVHAHDCFLFLAGDHRHPTDIWCIDEQFIFVLP